MWLLLGLLQYETRPVTLKYCTLYTHTHVLSYASVYVLLNMCTLLQFVSEGPIVLHFTKKVDL